MQWWGRTPPQAPRHSGTQASLIYPTHRNLGILVSILSGRVEGLPRLGLADKVINSSISNSTFTAALKPGDPPSRKALRRLVPAWPPTLLKVHFDVSTVKSENIPVDVALKSITGIVFE